ncbi:MAG TPA: class F sortase [Candidatus Paceibacterota bacterium]|nr:class F sortase [Candidatus Paceibacterota bacterium]
MTMKRLAVIVMIAAAAAVFTATAIRAAWYAPEEPQAPPSGGAVAALADDPPVRLVIPALHIDAGVQDLGMNAKGNMMAPSTFTDVGWYDRGPAPGSSGTAVIDGHVDNGLGLAGVFRNLASIATGTDIYVRTRSGATRRFVVIRIESYPYDAAPASLIFGAGGEAAAGAALNLITCEGTWVPGGDTYDHRLVVFSTYVGS